MARYGLTDFERRVVQTLLPNKPRGGPSSQGGGDQHVQSKMILL